MKLKNKKLLIAFCGHKQSGKTALSDILVDHYCYTKYPLAKPMKESLKILFGFSDEQLYGNLKEVIDPRYNVTPRKVMQIFGTEIFQFQLPKLIPELQNRKRNHWMFLFKEWYEKNTNLNIVISDLRFPHEAKFIKDLGGYIVRIYREGYNGDSHASEVDIDDIKPDFEIFNKYDLEYLCVMVTELLDKIESKKKELSEFSFDIPTKSEIEEYLEDTEEDLDFY